MRACVRFDERWGAARRAYASRVMLLLSSLDDVRACTDKKRTSSFATAAGVEPNETAPHTGPVAGAGLCRYARARCGPNALACPFEAKGLLLLVCKIVRLPA